MGISNRHDRPGGAAMFRRVVMTPDEVLSRVGITTERLLLGAKTVLSPGRLYIVGSLSQGFGNRGSDIDLHLFSREVEVGGALRHLFVETVPVGVETYRDSEPSRKLAPLTTRRAHTALGPIALAAPLEPAEQKLFGLWAMAIPLLPGTPPVLNAEQEILVYAHLMRAGLCRVLFSGALAETIDAADLDSGYAWQSCRRSLLELLCLSRGMPPVGAKWLPRRVRQLLPEPLVEAVDRVEGTDALMRLLNRLDMPGLTPRVAVTVVREPTAVPIRLGSDHLLLSRFNQLEPESVVSDSSPQGIVRAMRQGVARLQVDEQALNDALTRSRTL